MKTLYITIFILFLALILVGCSVLNEVTSGTDIPLETITAEASNESAILSPPSFNVDGGGFNAGDHVVVEIINPNTSGEIFYTLNNTIPDKSSIKYNEPITVLKNAKNVVCLTAVVIGNNGNKSSSVYEWYEYYVVFKDSSVEEIVCDFLKIDIHKVRYNMLQGITQFTAWGDIAVVNNQARFLYDLGYNSEIRHFNDGTKPPETRGKIQFLDDFKMMPDLIELTINFNSIEAIPDLSNLSLNRVCLEDNRITDISGLASQKHLRYVYLDNNIITDARALGGISKKSLWRLSLSNNPIEFFPDMSMISDVKNLRMDTTGLTDWPLLSKNTDFNLLDFSNNNISALVSPPECLNVEFLDFSYNALSNISSLADIEKPFKYYNQSNELFYRAGSCRILDISGNNISDFSPLLQLSKLKKLIIRDNSQPLDMDILNQMIWLDELIIE